jgi:hypothetical protein
MAGAVPRVVEVLCGGPRIERRPEHAFDLLAMESMIGRQGEELHEAAHLAATPRVGLHRPAVDPRREAAEQPEPEPAGFDSSRRAVSGAGARARTRAIDHPRLLSPRHE